MTISIEAPIVKLEKLKMCCMLIPEATLIQLNNDQEKGRFNQRVIATVNESITWQGGVVAYGEGYGYVTLSKARMKQLDVVEGETVQLKLEKDDSKYGHEIPEALQPIFNQDDEAKKRFENLSPGFQRTIIYYINQVKDSDKQLERILLYLTNLKECIPGKETMRDILRKRPL